MLKELKLFNAVACRSWDFLGHTKKLPVNSYLLLEKRAWFVVLARPWIRKPNDEARQYKVNLFFGKFLFHLACIGFQYKVFSFSHLPFPFAPILNSHALFHCYIDLYFLIILLMRRNSSLAMSCLNLNIDVPFYHASLTRNWWTFQIILKNNVSVEIRISKHQ